MVNEIILQSWLVFQLIIGFNLIFPLILFISYRIEARGPKTKKQKLHSENDYAVIVTAYEQTDFIPDLIKSVIDLNYQNFLVYIVADNCNITDLVFEDERIIVLRPDNILASNTASHLYAIERFNREHKYLTILDSDNLVHPDYLTHLNTYFNSGFKAVQAIRKPRNLDTTYACLDAARDIYYHFYDGEVLFALGSSATLAGSGMAFETDLYQQCFSKGIIKGAGFDKVLQAALVSQNVRIAFSKEAIVYDQKTSQSNQLVLQRARWINTWFRYFFLGYKLIVSGLKTLSFNQVLFGIVLLRPPLFIFLILSFLCMLANIWIDPINTLTWGFAFMCFFLAFCLALIKPDTDPRIIRSLISIPKFIFYQVISLFSSFRSKNLSVATKHIKAADRK